MCLIVHAQRRTFLTFKEIFGVIISLVNIGLDITESEEETKEKMGGKAEEEKG